MRARKTGVIQGFEDESVIAYILRETAKALKYFHDNMQIHRDLKAGNILLSSDAKVFLSDFGVAAPLRDDKKRQTFVGTPCWMAPEVLEQTNGYDYKADVWSFGITAIELAYGEAPYQRLHPLKVMKIILEKDPPRIDRRRWEPPYVNLVESCLQKAPDKRPTCHADLLIYRAHLQSPLFCTHEKWGSRKVCLELVMRLVVVARVVARVVRRLGLLLVRVLRVFLALRDLLERFRRHLLGVFCVVSDEDVVKDRALVDDPELKANSGEGRVLCVRLRLVVGVGDHRVHPLALVVGVVDHWRLPLALELRVVNHGRLPLAVLLRVPVLRLLCLRVRDLRRDVVVPVGLFSVGVSDLLGVNPVIRLGHVRVLHLLLGELPAVLDLARRLLLAIELDHVVAIWFEDERVHVRELILVRVVELDLVVLQQVIALVVEDQVDPAHIVAAKIGAKHDGVVGVATKLCLVDLAREKLNVATAAKRVLLLLVLHCELENERLVDGRRGSRHLRREAVKAHVLGRLQALRDVLCLLVVPRAWRQLPLPHL